MIAKTAIEKNLHGLDALYRKSTSAKHSLYFAKLAILELCGWIEMSMDDITQRCANKHVQEQVFLAYVANRIKRTYGFEYDQHFRELLVKLFGIINFERIEKKVDSAKLARLKGALDALKIQRNSEAHTYVKGVTRTIDAPSLTLAKFADVYDGLKDFETIIRKYRF